jgi:dihydroxy-acid dehydratase
MAEAIARWDIMQAHDPEAAVHEFFKAAPGGVPDPGRVFAEPALERARHGSRARHHPLQRHAFTKDGGLAVLYGNIAEKGCIVKTAGWMSRSGSSPARPACTKARKTRWRASWVSRCRPVMWS